MIHELDPGQTCHQRCCVVVQYMCSVATDRDLEEKDQEKETKNGRETRKGPGSKKNSRKKRSKSRKKKTTEGKEGREKETRKGSEEINLLFRLFFC